MKIVIVEDEFEAKKRLEECLERYAEDNNLSFEISWFNSGEKFLEAKNNDADIIFMDIELPGKNGVETAKCIRETNTRSVIMFVTNLAQYAIEGYAVNALDYVLKPINYYSFKLKISKAVEAVRQKNGVMLQVSSEKGTEYIKSSDVHYIEVQNHDLIYHTVYGQIKGAGTLKKLEERLKDDGFFRCNYCYLVNLRFVEYIHGNDVTVGSDCLQISRNRKKEFLQKLTEFYGRGGI